MYTYVKKIYNIYYLFAYKRYTLLVRFNLKKTAVYQYLRSANLTFSPGAGTDRHVNCRYTYHSISTFFIDHT